MGWLIQAGSGLLGWLLLANGMVWAQAPGSLNPGLQLQQQLQLLPPPPPPPDTEKPLLRQPESPDDTSPRQDKPSVLLRGVTFVGNQHLRAAELDRPFRALIGRQITLEQLQAAAAAAQALIRNQGYITSLVVIPPQSFTSGVVTVRVVESFIEALELRGGGEALQAYIRKMLQPILGDPNHPRPFNLRELERQLLLMRSFGAVDVSPTLTRGRQFGSSLLVAEVRPARINASLFADNNLPLQLGTWRLGAQVQGYTPSSQPVKLLALGSYAFPYPGSFSDGIVQASTLLGNQGWRGELLWGVSSASSKDLLTGPSTLQTGGVSNYWSAGVSYPLLVRRNSMLNVGLKTSLQNSSNDLYLDGQRVLDLSTDRLRAMRLSLDGYSVSPWAVNQLGFLFSQGFSGLGSGLAADEVPSNPNGPANFTTARLNLSRQQKLAAIGSSATLLTLKATGQLSASAVPVPEQFSYGGPFYGRAFNSVYLLGDQGWATSIELGQQLQLVLSRRTYNLMPFAWYDYGATSNHGGGLASAAAGSYGIGARGTLWGSNSTFELGWGIPSSNTLQPNQIGARNSIVFFRIGLGL